MQVTLSSRTKVGYDNRRRVDVGTDACWSEAMRDWDDNEERRRVRV